MKLSRALCAALFCLGACSTLPTYGRARGLSVRLFNNSVPRPPRSVPLGRSRGALGSPETASERPLPRPRPATAPPAPAAVTQPVLAPAVHPTAAEFPPVAPLE